MINMNQIFLDLAPYSDKFGVKLTYADKRVYYYLLLKASENTSSGDEDLFFDTSVTRLMKENDLARLSINRAIKKLTTCGLIVRKFSKDLPTKNQSQMTRFYVKDIRSK